VQVLDRGEGRVDLGSAVAPLAILRARPEKVEVLVDDVLDPEEDIVKARRRIRGARVAPWLASAEVIAWTR